ncbi:MAG: hypothetical protein WA755_12235 [Candidatus Acidiferrales bacterium]
MTHSHKYVRYLVLTLALSALLVVTTTLGQVWHNHDSSSEQTCPICHINHQPIEKPLASTRLPILAPIGRNIDIVPPSFEPTPDFRRVPARAPPTV